nr:glucosyltransferase [uncultured Mediterranean phage uvMED]
MFPSISYAITTHNESIKNLIDLLSKYKTEHDEIVILDDYSTNRETKSNILRADVLVYKKLINDYACHKNILFEFCTKDYIFQLDGDELPTEHLLKNIKNIIFKHKHIDLFFIPRENYFNDVDFDQIKEMGFVSDDKLRVGYPDYQGRIYKNIPSLRWENNVHERIRGNKNVFYLKKNTKHFILHKKEIQIQINSNAKYKKLQKFKPETPKNLCVVSSYFNPCNYISKFLNCIDFIQHIKSFGIECIIVESQNVDSKYCIKSVYDNVISVKATSTYWQKESLLNIGIQTAIEKKYEYIAVLDNDIEFKNNNWHNQLIDSTEFYGASHVFEYAYIENERKTINKKAACSKFLSNISDVDNIKALLKRKGEPGYGFCFRHDVIKEYKLYDKAILGTGDLLNLIGFCEIDKCLEELKKDRFFKNNTKEFFLDYVDWTKTVPHLKYGIGYTPNKIEVKYHGNFKNKNYINREYILKEYKFDPSKDLIVNETGLYKLTNKNLENKILEYFKSRKEDDLIEITETALKRKATQFILKNQDIYNNLGFV